MKKNKSDIRSEVVDGVSYVYVLDKHGKRCFCREKTKQTIGIAHAIFMYEQYGERYEANEKRKAAAQFTEEKS